MRISPETEAPGHPTIPLQWLRSSSLLLVCCWGRSAESSAATSPRAGWRASAHDADRVGSLQKWCTHMGWTVLASQRRSPPSPHMPPWHSPGLPQGIIGSFPLLRIFCGRASVELVCVGRRCGCIEYHPVECSRVLFMGPRWSTGSRCGPSHS